MKEGAPKTAEEVEFEKLEAERIAAGVTETASTTPVPKKPGTFLGFRNPFRRKEKDPRVTTEEEEVKREVESLPEEEKEKIALGLGNIGFKLEKTKNEFFANTLNFFATTGLNNKGAVNSFLLKFRDSFARDAKAAQQKIEDAASGKSKRGLTNASLLFGNIAKYGRIIADFTTNSVVSPLRYVMMVGAIGSRSADAMKEARLSNEEVIGQTRIDVDKATEEAWQIYRNAMAEKVDSSELSENENLAISTQELKKAYVDRLPKDLLERLGREPGEATGLIQKVIKSDLGGAIKKLNTKIEKIENDSKLSPAEKETKKQMLLRTQERNLLDYDRILTQYGTVDGLAIAGRYAKTAGNAVVWATTAETLALSVGKLWENLASALSHSEASQVLTETPAGSPEQAMNTLRGVGIGTNTPESFTMPDPDDHSTFAELTRSLHPQAQQFHQFGTGATEINTDVSDAGNTTLPNGLKMSPLMMGDKPGVTSLGDMKMHESNIDHMLGRAGAGVATGATAEEVAKGVSGAKEAATAVHFEAVGHSIDHPTDFNIGKGPGALEHTYEKILLDHRALPSTGIALDHEGATRTLNEAANLVRLTETHGAAGITSAEFAEAAKFENGVLHILNPAKFNEIIDRLHEHSATLVKAGMVTDPNGAGAYAGNVNWLEKLHAANMHDTAAGTGTGIPGHPELTADNIGKMPPPHAIGNVHAGAEFQYTNITPPEVDLRHVGMSDAELSELVTRAQHAGVAVDSAHDLTPHTVPSPNDTVVGPPPAEGPIRDAAVNAYQEPHDFNPLNQSGPGDGKYTGYNNPTQVSGFNTPHGLSPEALQEVSAMARTNISHIFPTNTEDTWNMVKGGSAFDTLHIKPELGTEKFAEYMHKVQEVSGLDPVGKTLLTPFPETNVTYLERALQFIKATKPERLAELKF